MAIILGFGNNPTITPHEANGLAMLLGTFGTEAGLSLAEKLQQGAAANGSQAPIELADPERSALRRAIGSLRRDRLPQHLLAIGDALADDRDAGMP